MALEEALQLFCKNPKAKIFLERPTTNADGDINCLTVQGIKAYEKLVGCLYELEGAIGNSSIFDSEKIVTELDSLVDSPSY